MWTDGTTESGKSKGSYTLWVKKLVPFYMFKQERRITSAKTNQVWIWSPYIRIQNLMRT